MQDFPGECEPEERVRLSLAESGTSFGVVLAHAFRANTVGEINADRVVEVSFHMPPVLLIVSYLLAMHTNRDDILQQGEFRNVFEDQ